LVRAQPEIPIIVGTTDSVESSLDPANAYDFFGWQMIKALGSGLVEFIPGSIAGPDNVTASLATSWQVSDYAKVWTFNLRHGVMFDDGTEFNATHVKYSFDRGMYIADPNGPFVGIGYSDLIDNVTVTDTYTVTFFLKVPFAPFLSILALPPSYIVDPKYAPFNLLVSYVDGNPRASNPLGLGPYSLKNWTRIAGKDYEMQLEANPNYWNASGGYPRTQNIAIKFLENSTGLENAITTGDIDIAYRQLDSDAIDTIEAMGTLHVWEEASPSIQYLVFQEKYAPFNVTEIRRAIGASINRTAIVQTAFQGKAKELYSMIPQGMFSHTDAFKHLGDPNYTLTRQLLSDFGYNETNKLNFTLWYENSGRYPQSSQVTQALKTSIEASGVITVGTSGTDWPSYRTKRQNEEMEAFIMGWYPDYTDPDDYTYPFVHSLGGSWLHHNYNSSQMDQLAESARTNISTSERSMLYDQIQNLTVDDSPVIPIFQGMQYCVTKLDIEAVYLDITEFLRYSYIVPEFAVPTIMTVLMTSVLIVVLLNRLLSNRRRFIHPS